MRVVAFGAGSLGSLVGGLLAREHDVWLVGRDPHVGAVRERGLRIDGEVTAHVHPRAVTELPAERFELAVVTVKAFDTAAAAQALAGADVEAALSLQNGLGNEETLAAALDCPVLAGTCTYGARLEAPGRVACTGVGEVTLGPRESGESARRSDGAGESAPDSGGDMESALADRVGDAFDRAGIETTVASDMPRRLWEKLAVNAGINAVTALADVDNGALVDGPARETARAAARETATVARESGVDLPDEAAANAVTEVADATAANASSMRQDVHRESRTEIDAINGAVVERASGPVPVNETLTALVRAWERERGLR